MSTQLFVVFRLGVYRHQCGGVFSTQDLAETAAKALLAGEKDDYHQYQVVPFVLDQQTTQRELETKYSMHSGKTHSYFTGGEVEEAGELSRWERNKGVIQLVPPS